jgi:hypothetical protein
MTGLFFLGWLEWCFCRGFWENVAADRGFLVVKSWWIAGERWSGNDLKSGAKNTPLFSELFLRLPVGRRAPGGGCRLGG